MAVVLSDSPELVRITVPSYQGRYVPEPFAFSLQNSTIDPEPVATQKYETPVIFVTMSSRDTYDAGKSTSAATAAASSGRSPADFTDWTDEESKQLRPLSELSVDTHPPSECYYDEIIAKNPIEGVKSLLDQFIKATEPETLRYDLRIEKGFYDNPVTTKHTPKNKSSGKVETESEETWQARAHNPSAPYGRIPKSWADLRSQVSARSKAVSKEGRTLSELEIYRHFAGPHNALRKDFPLASDYALHQYMKSIQDSPVTPDSLKKAEISRDFLQQQYSKGMPISDNVDLSRLSRTIMTYHALGIKSKNKPVVYENSCEVKHTNDCDHARSKTELAKDYPDIILPEDMSEEDEMHMTMACRSHLARLLTSTGQLGESLMMDPKTQAKMAAVCDVHGGSLPSGVDTISTAWFWRETDEEKMNRIKREINRKFDRGGSHGMVTHGLHSEILMSYLDKGETGGQTEPLKLSPGEHRRYVVSSKPIKNPKKTAAGPLHLAAKAARAELDSLSSTSSLRKIYDHFDNWSGTRRSGSSSVGGSTASMRSSRS